jgi:glycosyltransferase involved in cell wall biosynthesis
MPRILLLVTDLNIGGTPTVVRELAIRLAPFALASGGEIQVASLAPRGPVSDQIAAAGITAHSLDAKGPRNARVVARLLKLIKREKIDTVFSFLLHANAAAAAVSLFARNVRFLQSIQTTQPDPKWHWKVQKLAQRAAEKIVVPSPSVAQAAREWCDVPEQKTLVIPNAIDPHDFRRGGVLPPSLEFPIGFLGRLDPIKRIPDLVTAMRDIPRAHLHIFGDGSARSQIEQIAQEHGVSHRVTLHGAVQHPQDALSQVQLLVLPSAAEGFGLVLIEAMAASIPIVATNVPGIRDVVKDGQTGILVPLGDPQELAQAINRLIGDEPLRNRLIQAAQADVRKRFTWDVVLPQYRQLLRI